MTTFEEILKEDKILESVVKSVKLKYGCYENRINQTKFAYFIGLIIGQRIKFDTARQIRAKLYKLLDGNRNFDPDDILSLDQNKLREIGIPKTKITTIIRVAKQFDENNVDKLLNIKGIGNWTINTFKIQYGLVNNIFELHDNYVTKKITEKYGISKSHIAEFIDYQKWNEYSSQIFWYFWKFELP